jgi:hypothetical protein
VNVVVYVLNRCPMKSVDGMTPFEAWHGRKLVVHHLRTFGCIVYVRNTTPHQKKLEDRGCKMIFALYESGSNAYHAYDPITKHGTGAQVATTVSQAAVMTSSRWNTPPWDRRL